MVVSHTCKKYKHYQGIYFSLEAVHSQPKKTKPRKRKLYDATAADPKFYYFHS